MGMVINLAIYTLEGFPVEGGMSPQYKELINPGAF